MRFKKYRFFIHPVALVVLFAFVSLSSFHSNAQPDIDQVLTHVDELWRGTSSHTSMTMRVATEHYQREMQLDGWSKGKEHALVVITAPKKDRGIATLKSEVNVWNYLPKINRVTKVPPSMMSGSWMGSHFSNDDLVKESTFLNDYNAQLTFEGMRNARSVYELTLIPKEQAAVVWGKVVLVIQVEELLPLSVDYYDEEGVKKRVLEFSQPKRVGERLIPFQLTLTPTDKPNESTTIIYQTIDFSVDLEDSFFSIQNLKKKRF